MPVINSMLSLHHFQLSSTVFFHRQYLILLEKGPPTYAREPVSYISASIDIGKYAVTI